jgi:hypothetical protein
MSEPIFSTLTGKLTSTCCYTTATDYDMFDSNPSAYTFCAQNVTQSECTQLGAGFQPGGGGRWYWFEDEETDCSWCVGWQPS